MSFDIEKIKRQMLVKYPFFGSVVANVDYRISEDLSTAATDGTVIYYNPSFLEGLNVSEQIFIFAHEVCHIAFNHILRSEGKDPQIWNVATDAVINAFFKRDGLQMIRGGVDMVDAINYDAEQLYEKLLEEKNNQEQNELENQSQQQIKSENEGQQQEEGQQNQNRQGSSEGQNQKDSIDNQEDFTSEKDNQDVGHDTHSMWNDAVKRHKEQKDNQNKSLNEGFNKDDNSEKDKEEISEKEAFKKNLEE